MEAVQAQPFYHGVHFGHRAFHRPEFGVRGAFGLPAPELIPEDDLPPVGQTFQRADVVVRQARPAMDREQRKAGSATNPFKPNVPARDRDCPLSHSLTIANPRSLRLSAGWPPCNSYSQFERIVFS